MVVLPLAEVVRTSFRLNLSNIPSGKIKFASDKYSFIVCCLFFKERKITEFSMLHPHAFSGDPMQNEIPEAPEYLVSKSSADF